MKKTHLLSIPLLHSAWTAKAMAQPASDASGMSLGNMILQGGWAMIPLCLCSMTLIYLLIQSYRDTKAEEFGDNEFARRIKELCVEGKLKEAIDQSKRESSLLGRALTKALPKLESENLQADTDSFDALVADVFSLEENAVGQRIHYINVVAAVAPMIGLLGTVSGMIGAFQTMSSGGMGRPELLAGDIGEALITTATGLCIGIPAMIAYSYFSNRLNNQLVENSQHASEIGQSAKTRIP